MDLSWAGCWVQHTFFEAISCSASIHGNSFLMSVLTLAGMDRAMMLFISAECIPLARGITCPDT